MVDLSEADDSGVVMGRPEAVDSGVMAELPEVADGCRVELSAVGVTDDPPFGLVEPENTVEGLEVVDRSVV
jgi:hypothetical protein